MEEQFGQLGYADVACPTSTPIAASTAVLIAWTRLVVTVVRMLGRPVWIETLVESPNCGFGAILASDLSQYRLDMHLHVRFRNLTFAGNQFVAHRAA